MKKLLLGLALVLGGAASAQAAAVPEFPGGKTALTEYITSNLKYPQTAMDNGIEGVVAVTFTVKSDGTIGNIKIKRMIDPDLETEAVRLVKNMPKWIPADSGDAPAEVDIPFNLPE